jgi:threonine aldolase
MAEKLKAAGAIFADWPKDTAEADVAPVEGKNGQGEVMIRLVASFATTEDHVDQFLEAAQRAEAA